MTTNLVLCLVTQICHFMFVQRQRISLMDVFKIYNKQVVSARYVFYRQARKFAS